MSGMYLPDDEVVDRGKKQGILKPVTSRLACDRVIHLPFQMAVVYSAAQNFMLDLVKGIHPHMRDWRHLQYSYLYEAEHLLTTEGANLYPGENDEPWIHKQYVTGNYQVGARMLVTPQDEEDDVTFPLKMCFAVLFNKNDDRWLNSELFPDPEIHNTYEKIQSLSNEINKVLVHH